MKQDTKDGLTLAALTVGAAIAAAVAVYYCGQAAAKVVVKTKAAMKKTDVVQVMGVDQDLKTGKSTLHIMACGTLIDITVDKEDLELQNPEVTEAIQGSVDAACAGF